MTLMSGRSAEPRHFLGFDWAPNLLAVLRHRFEDVGVYFLDEPEAALSSRSSLALLKLMDIMRREGSQLVVATHSPILVSLPGATERFLKHLLANDVAEGESEPER